MDVIHISEADVVKDIEIVLAKVRQGREIIVEQGNNPVAIIMDDTFAQDIEEGLRAQRQPWTPPSSE